MNLTWKTYQNWLNYLSLENISDFKLPVPHPNRVKIDSRIIGPGDWFCPIVGEKFDGHRFISDVIDTGASGFFYDINKKQDIAPHLLSKGIAVTDTLQTLQQIAKGWRLSLKNLRLISLTGSVGKTTTKEMLNHFLNKVGNTLVTKGNFNNEIGVPLSLLALNESHDYAVIEMGARHIGDIKFLSQLAEANIAICLNVGTAHLGEFGSIENLLNTKLEIFSQSPPQTTCIAYSDDHRIMFGAQKTKKKIISFGVGNSSDVKFVKEEILNDGSSNITLSIQSTEMQFKIGASHDAYKMNLAASVATCIGLGIPLNKLLNGLNDFYGVDGRFKIHKIHNNSFIIDDCYNANPESMKSGLISLLKIFPNRAPTVVIGDMLELGDESVPLHNEIGNFILNNFKNIQVIAVGPFSKNIHNIISSSKKSGFSSLWFENVESLIHSDLFFLKDQEIIFIKGSNGIKLNCLLNKLLNH